MAENRYQFEVPTYHRSIIKVIGVGGGGSNAVNHMYNMGIKDVEFIICNTDAQALRGSPVPNKLQIGANLTQGLGAGANPQKGKNAAIESKEDIRELLSQNTKMVFITAGMGGGTGTGAAPVIAKVSQELDILTVGIVTVPFVFEGKKKMAQAQEGIKELKEFCDTVLVIPNDRLREIYGNLPLSQAFAQADNILTTAAKSIAEIITVPGYVNVDFEDVKTVMKGAGAAVMGSAKTEGDQRCIRAAELAISSPLLDNRNIHGAQRILLSIMSGEKAELQMDELSQITEYIQGKAGDEAELIFGHGIDTALGESIQVTVIATGFQDKYYETKKKVYDLESTKQIDLFEDNNSKKTTKDSTTGTKTEKKVYQLEKDNLNDTEDSSSKEEIKKEILSEKVQERIKKLKSLSGTFNSQNDQLKEELETPAYLRKKVNLEDLPHSSEKNISRYNLNEDGEITTNNRFYMIM